MKSGTLHYLILSITTLFLQNSTHWSNCYFPNTFIPKNPEAGQSEIIFKAFADNKCFTNTYIIGSNKEAAIIDAGCHSKEVLEYVKSAGLKVKYIILTHGHSDHVTELAKLKSGTGAKIVIQKNGQASLKILKVNAADTLVTGGAILKVGTLNLEIIYTPGHHNSCICIKAGKKLFSGDTLFLESIGNTISKSSNDADMVTSLQTLMKLNDDIEVYPGHGASTTIGHERAYNPFFKH